MDFEDGNRRAAPPPSCIRWRYVVAILGSMGMGIIYGLKVNLHISITAMVNKTGVKMLEDEMAALAGDDDGSRSIRSAEEHSTSTPDPSLDGPFIWSAGEKGIILSSYFIGYFITQVPGGRLAELWSGKYLFLIAVLMNTVGALLTPICCESIYALLAVRIFQGLGGGFSFPAENVIIHAWAPSDERSTITSIIFGGACLGTVLSMMLSGVINSTLGWVWTFYLQGGASLIWCVLWVILVSDGPDSHTWISEGEKHLIMASHPPKEAGAAKPPAPWKAIFTSPAFLALTFAHACNNFGWYLFLVEVPMYLHEGLGMSPNQVTTASTIPFFTNYGFSVVFSKVLDAIREKGYITMGTARKIAVGTASLVPAVCLLAMNLLGNKSQTGSVALMIIAITFYGAMFSGVFSNQNDLAPNFGGILMGITNMAATIPGILVPVVVSAMVGSEHGVGPWQPVYYITLVILIVEFIVFAILGKGEVQPWNDG